MTQPSSLSTVSPIPQGLQLKIRRIIDEWRTGVKWKISLSFKGIIDIARSAEGSRSELRIDAFQVPTHGGAECGQLVGGGHWSLQDRLGKGERKTGVDLDGHEASPWRDRLELKSLLRVVHAQHGEGCNDLIEPTSNSDPGGWGAWAGNKIDARHERPW
jgi:hypothetical protein